MVQIKHVITGSTAILGGIAGVLVSFFASKRSEGPTVRAAIVYGVIGAAIGAIGGYLTASKSIEEESFS